MFEDHSKINKKEQSSISIEDKRDILTRAAAGIVIGLRMDQYSNEEILGFIAESGISNEDLDFVIKTNKQREGLAAAGAGVSLLTDEEKMREYGITRKLTDFFYKKEAQLDRSEMREEAFKGECSKFFLNALQPSEILILITQSGNEYKIFSTAGKLFIMDQRSNAGKIPSEQRGSYLSYSGDNDVTIEKGKPFHFAKTAFTTDIVSIRLSQGLIPSS